MAKIATATSTKELFEVAAALLFRIRKKRMPKQP
jgi:hypothetical protein